MGIKAGKQLLKEEQFDVINTHFALPSGPVGDSLSRFAKIPNVLSVHGGDLYDPSKFTSPHRHLLLRLWIRKLLRNADQVVGQSKNTLANVDDFYEPNLPTSRIPLGIQRPPTTPGSREAYGFKPEDVLLVTVGRLVARKANAQLIAMMETLKDENAHLLILGSGPQEEMLRGEIASRGLNDKVHLMGYVEEADKSAILNMSDLYVSTSQHEGFGLGFVEGMASGMPVVCYDHGGQTDFLEDGETGYLATLNDLDTFTERCRRLISDTELRNKMGQHNLQAVEPLFIESCALSYEEIFEEVVAKHREMGSSVKR